MLKLCAALILTLSVSVIYCSKEPTDVTLCEGKKETISCEVGKKIKILDAFYGRREQKLCKGLIEIVLPGIDCSTANALDITKEECEGMQSCELHAVSDEYGNPCLLNSEYLKVSFKCVDSRQNEEQRVRVCEHGKQVIECPNKREISVVSAIYGRMKGFHVCAGFVLDKNCESSTSFAVVKNDCQGKSSCELFANNDKFGGDPCFGTNKYLEVRYACKLKAPCY